MSELTTKLTIQEVKKLDRHSWLIFTAKRRLVSIILSESGVVADIDVEAIAERIVLELDGSPNIKP